jgi:hypothetical protein
MLTPLQSSAKSNTIVNANSIQLADRFCVRHRIVIQIHRGPLVTAVPSRGKHCHGYNRSVGAFRCFLFDL